MKLDAGPAPKVVDLFCGAGGLGLGFRSQGFDIVWAADAFSAAVETYKKNIGDHIEEAKLDWNTVLPSCDIIIGGPPCQGFSSAGLRKPGDARNTLVAVFAHLVARHRPKAFVFENVEGFLTGEGGRWVTDLLDPLVKAGYCIHLRKVNAANYGVPQHRKRVLAIGGLGWDPGFPEATHRATGAPGADLVAGDLPWCESVTSALDGLPPAADDPETAPVSDHYSRPPNEMDRLRFVANGGTLFKLPNSGISTRVWSTIEDYADGCWEWRECFVLSPFFRTEGVGDLEPHIAIPVNFADYVSNRDAALDAILADFQRR